MTALLTRPSPRIPRSWRVPLGLPRAVQLRPIIVATDTIGVPSGVQWALDIQRNAVERIEFGRVKAPPKRTPGYLRATLGQPNVLIDLRGSRRARGPYGLTRDVRRIGLVIDDLTAFRELMESQRA